MKLSKLMLSAFAFAIAMVACNKVETGVTENTSLKSVKLSLENVVMTKAVAEDAVTPNSPVMVNNFRIILTDDSYSMEYSAKTADGTQDATFYFDSETFASGPKEYEFHYVDHKVTRVIAVANIGNKSLSEIKAFIENIENQQDPTELVLWDNEILESTGDVHTQTGSDKYTEVFAATLVLKPTISRFEVDGFVVDFSDDSDFDKVEVVDIAFDHYYPNMRLSNPTTGVVGAYATGEHIKYVNDLKSDADVLGWFNNTSTTGLWYRDHFSTPLVLVKDDPTTTDVAENKADTPSPLAYHFFAGDLPPTMIIKLLADGNPAYVYTSRFISNKTNSAISVIEPGVIYRMSASGVAKGDGSVTIPDDLDPIERCLDITVDVQDWVVELVTPEF